MYIHIYKYKVDFVKLLYLNFYRVTLARFIYMVIIWMNVEYKATILNYKYDIFIIIIIFFSFKY